MNKPSLIPSPKSIRFRLTVGAMATILVLTAILYGMIEHRLRRDLTKQYDRYLRGYAEDLGFLFRDSPSDPGAVVEQLRRRIRHFRSMSVEFRAVTPSGEIVFTTAGWVDYPLPVPTPPPEEFQTVRLRSRHYAFRLVQRQVALEGHPLLLTQTAVLMKPLTKTLMNYRRNMLIAVLLLLILSGLGTLILTRAALRPAVALSEAANGISMGNIERRLPELHTRDELEQLVTSLNSMLDRLQRAMQALEHFATDLAHELRTPVTQLVGETESALTGNPDKDALRALLVRHSAVYSDMTAMLVDLLGLIRPGTADDEEDSAVLIEDICREVFETFRPVAEDRTVDLVVLPGPADTQVQGVERRLRRVLANLVDNAIGHTEPGGKVEINWEENSEEVRLRVQDNGVGIAAKDLPRVFDRFFRRAGAGGRTGFGLGLAICRKVAEDHGGSVDLVSTQGAGTTATLRLPPSRQQPT